MLEPQRDVAVMIRSQVSADHMVRTKEEADLAYVIRTIGGENLCEALDGFYRALAGGLRKAEAQGLNSGHFMTEFYRVEPDA
jgi:hypothetical protein